MNDKFEEWYKLQPFSERSMAAAWQACALACERKVLHCDKCGASHYDDGFHVECPFCRIKELEENIALWQELNECVPKQQVEALCQQATLAERARCAEKCRELKDKGIDYYMAEIFAKAIEKGEN